MMCVPTSVSGINPIKYRSRSVNSFGRALLIRVYPSAFAAKIPALVKQPHPNPLNIVANSKVVSILIVWNGVDHVDEVVIIREISIEPFADLPYRLLFSFANPFEE